MEIKKMYYIVITFLPVLGMFMPPILFGMTSVICFALLVFNFRLFKKIIKFDYNYLVFIFGIFSLIMTLINKNYSGLPISVGLNMIILYFMYLRYIMNERLFNLMYAIISVGNICSYFYTKSGKVDEITNILIEILRNSFHLNFDYFNSDITTSSVFLNRNYYGYVVILVIILSVFIIIKDFRKIKECKDCIYEIVLATITIFFNIQALILTESRGAYLALIVGLIVLLIMEFNSLILFAIPFAGFILLNINNLITYLPRFETILSSLQSRLNLWHTGLEYINKNPWFGNGFYALLSKEGIPHSHNIFIEALVCFGIIGIFLISTFVMLTLWNRAKDWVNNQDKSFPLVMSIIIATMVHGFNDMILLNPATILLFVIIYSFSEVKIFELKTII